MIPITSNLSREDQRPYFLWDEAITVAEFRHLLKAGEPAERLRLMAKLLREAREDHVWEFVSPGEVARVLPELEYMLGRRKGFWRYLIDGWRQDGLL